MKKLSILLVIILGFGFTTQLNPEPKKLTKKFFPEIELDINTPAFRKKKGFTKYDDLISYLDELQTGNKDVMTISYIGESQKGKAIPLVTLNRKSDEPKVRVWFQGGLHGDEMASTEAVLFMMSKILQDSSYAHLLDRMVIQLVPMANIDGYEKKNRYAANGLDLNRDQTKLMVQESVSLKQAFSAFKAEVAVDFHEYRPYRRDYTKLSTFGVTSRYDAMFMYSGNLNVPLVVRNFTKNIFVHNAEKVLESAGIAYRDYVTTTKVLGDIHFNQGSNNARSSATSYALSNCISSLIEIRGVGLGRTSFKRRINSTFLIGMSYLQSAYSNVEAIKQVIEEGKQSDKHVVVTSEKGVEEMAIDFIDVETCEEIQLNSIVHNASHSNATLKRIRPTAYIIDKSQKELVEKLKVLGLSVEELKSDKRIEVEIYTVSAYRRAGEKYEGVYRQTVETSVSPQVTDLSSGCYIVYMNQKNANLVTEVLEPEAPNSFVSFNVLSTKLNATLPIYRYMKTDKL